MFQRHVFRTMGTVVSVEWTPTFTSTSSEARIESEFFELDQCFSLYRPESELARISRGELNMTDASRQTRAVYEEALEWRLRTEGAFTPHRPDGVIDLNGIVKALAILHAGAVFESAGVTHWCINAGGDLLVGPGSLPRTIGIVDPAKRSKLLCSLPLAPPHRALATSGTAERGDHIWRSPATTGPGFSQVSVCADDIVTADVLATAIVSGGPTTLRLVTERWPVDVIAVQQDGAILMTPSIRHRFAHEDAVSTAR